MEEVLLSMVDADGPQSLFEIAGSEGIAIREWVAAMEAARAVGWIVMLAAWTCLCEEKPAEGTPGVWSTDLQACRALDFFAFCFDHLAADRHRTAAVRAKRLAVLDELSTGRAAFPFVFSSR